MPPTPTPVPVQAELEAACDTFMQANRDGCGYIVKSFTVETQTGLSVQRGDGGLFGLFKIESANRENTARLAYTCELDLDWYERIARADAEAKSEDLTPADVRKAQEYITALARGWTKPPPAVGTDWDGAWADALRRALRDGGHPVLGAGVLTQRTFGWLEALAAKVQ